MNPGRTVFPFRSIVLMLSALALLRAPASLPTYATLFPRITAASTLKIGLNETYMFPFTSAKPLIATPKVEKTPSSIKPILR